MVPLDFWNNVRKELDAIKPVFMLAEWESYDLHAEAFDMTYSWSWFDALHNITGGMANLSILFVYYAWNEKAFPKDSMRMLFVTNHDKNAWEGTEYEKFGDGLEPTIVLSVISEGMPLIYNGQEAGNTKRLEFFEKDPIQWREHFYGDLYKKLFALKKKNTALWNGKRGARMIRVVNNVPLKVFSFVRSHRPGVLRENENDKVFAVFNFSDQPQTVKFRESLHHGKYTEYFSGDSVEFSDSTSLELKPWAYRVFVK
jgi:hypothetical protein